MARALHYVFKIANREASLKFFTETLLMKVLRHEEFSEGCKATCNGPYDTRWSKTMIGYGAEDTHFVFELTYNYGISHYDIGNDLIGIWITSSSVAKHAAQITGSSFSDKNELKLTDPDGHHFYLLSAEQPAENSVSRIAFNVKDLPSSIAYWHGILGMDIYEQDNSSAVLGFGENQCKLCLNHHGVDINRGSAFGRIAFSVPEVELTRIERKVKEGGFNVITPLITLDTPGKASVQVVILSDCDGLEICFVGDENYRKLSQSDAGAQKLLLQAIQSEQHTR